MFKSKIKSFFFKKAIKYEDVGNPIDHSFGSVDWLIATEKYLGGLSTNVKRHKVSPLDPRTPEEIATGGMTGGDRMFHHGYAHSYSKALNQFIVRRNDALTIVEVGILRGVGLALWSMLFPHARIIGLDIDLSHTKNNLTKLKDLGAFRYGDPELYLFDQLNPNSQEVEKIFDGKKIDVCIDDGLHSDEAIVRTATALHSHLASNFVYFVEDSFIEENTLRSIFRNSTLIRNGELTVVQ